MAKPIHSMIRVLEEKRSVDFYHRAFALDIADRYDFDGFTLVYLKGAESPFELDDVLARLRHLIDQREIASAPDEWSRRSCPPEVRLSN